MPWPVAPCSLPAQTRRMDSVPAPRPSNPAPSLAEGDCDPNYVPLSPEAWAQLEAGIRSAKEKPSVYLGSFAQYADDE
jgi:hypothetical protein